MPLRTRIFIIVSVLVLIILAISISLLLIQRKAKKTVDQPTDIITQTDQGAQVIDSGVIVVDSQGNLVTSTQYVAPVTSELEAQKNAAKQTARIFIERYGSYSTDNKQQNIKEVKSLVSASLWQELSAKIGSGSASGGDFLGVTTKVIAIRFAKWDATSATINVSTVRTETKNNSTKNTQQDAVVYVEKNNNNWMVSKFDWGKIL